MPFTFIGARANAPWLALVITDGVSTFDSEKTIPEAKNAKDVSLINIVIAKNVLKTSIEYAYIDYDSLYSFHLLCR